MSIVFIKYQEHYTSNTQTERNVVLKTLL